MRDELTLTEHCVLDPLVSALYSKAGSSVSPFYRQGWQSGWLSPGPVHRGQSLRTVSFFYVHVPEAGLLLLECLESWKSKSQLSSAGTSQPASDPWLSSSDLFTLFLNSFLARFLQTAKLW